MFTKRSLPSRRVPRGERPVLALVAVWSTALAGVVIVVCSFLPWGASGRAERTSWELLRSAERLDVLHGFGQEAGAVAWYFAPVAVAVIWLGAVWRRPLLVAVLGIAVGGLGIALAMAVRASPLQPEVGASATIAAGGLAVVSAAFTALRRKDVT